jgi:hypothetical protein
VADARYSARPFAPAGSQPRTSDLVASPRCSGSPAAVRNSTESRFDDQGPGPPQRAARDRTAPVQAPVQLRRHLPPRQEVRVLREGERQEPSRRPREDPQHPAGPAQDGRPRWPRPLASQVEGQGRPAGQGRRERGHLDHRVDRQLTAAERLVSRSGDALDRRARTGRDGPQHVGVRSPSGSSGTAHVLLHPGAP